MKVNYEKPEIEIIRFSTEEIMDIIDASMGSADNPWGDEED